MNPTRFLLRKTALCFAGLALVSSAAASFPSFVQWREAHFGLNASLPGAAATADPDGDGVSNLLEYALDGDPLSATEAPSLNLDTSSGALRASFARAADDVTYVVQSSTDLVEWTELARNPGTPGTVVDVDAPAGPRTFLRLEATPAVPQLYTPSPELKVAILGDSKVQYAASVLYSNGVLTRVEHQADGPITWARRGGRFQHVLAPDPEATAANLIPLTGDSLAVNPLFRGANFGYAGDTATGTLKRIDAVLATGAQIVIYAAGTNIGSTDNDPEVTKASIQEAVDRIVAADRTCIVCTIDPRITVAGAPASNSYEISTERMAAIMGINEWIRTTLPGPGVFVADTFADLVDPANPVYGNALPFTLRDGVHFAPRGAFLAGERLRGILEQIIAPGTWFEADPDAAAKVISSYSMSGSKSVNANSCSGVVPSDWSIMNTAGAGAIVSAESSLESSPTGQTWVIDVTSLGGGSSSANVQTLRIFPAPVNVAPHELSANDWVSWFVEYEVSGSEIAGSLQATLTAGTATAKDLGNTILNRATEPWPTAAYGGWFETPAIPVGAATSLVPRIDLDIRIDVPGSVQVRIKRALLRKVANPATVFPME